MSYFHYLLPLIMGIMIYILIKIYYPWKAKHQPIFWIITFSPIVILSFIDFSNYALKNTILSFFAGAIVAEVLKERFLKISTYIKEQIKDKLEGDPEIMEKERQARKRRSSPKSNKVTLDKKDRQTSKQKTNKTNKK